MEDTFINILSQTGFPIAVAAFLLIRIERRLDELNQTLVHMIEIFSKNS
ncbi:YvrJ protein family protein [Caminicella sporogenes DSM 14501]|uniref:YvrJ protein family protein n=1 Tax=Caminicella sporogenes DSM 14501 TaxID=1121266 RepID=A0A1M6RZC9_9FIRM|nr:YvrJ family protein [Caminicella sporogenes]WIF95545.1 YvrJ family protein [Caminicella sporogenes]SHK37811.1 YvrJ protein family protein [Caminicella sporogenes DSM 14501]